MIESLLVSTTTAATPGPTTAARESDPLPLVLVLSVAELHAQGVIRQLICHSKLGER